MQKTITEPIRKNRQFGVTTGAICILPCGYMYFQHQYLNLYLAIAGSLLLLFAWFFPQVLTFPRIIWEKSGHVLGIVNTYILLTLVCFLVIMPLGWLMRIAGKDLLGRKLLPQAKTYWEPTASISSMKHQF